MIERAQRQISPTELLRRQRIRDTLHIVFAQPDKKRKRSAISSALWSNESYSKKHKGRKRTKNSRTNISLGMKRKYETDPVYKADQEEIIQQLRADPEIARRIKEKLRGREILKSTRAKLSRALKGKSLWSEEKKRQRSKERKGINFGGNYEERRKSIKNRWHDGSDYRIRALPIKGLWNCLAEKGSLKRILNHNFFNQIELNQLEKFFKNYKAWQKIPEEIKPLLRRLRKAALKIG